MKCEAHTDTHQIPSIPTKIFSSGRFFRNKICCDVIAVLAAPFSKHDLPLMIGRGKVKS